MPESSGRALAKLQTCAAAPDLAATWYLRFGRLKLARKTEGSRSSSCFKISSRTRSVAVAVRASTEMSGMSCRTSLRRRYSGRKSWPQSLGRDVKKLVVPGVQALDPAAGFLRIQGRIQKRGRHAAGLKLVHLILH